MAFQPRLVVQVGANTHRDTCVRNCHDPTPRLIEMGWSALLFEPLPSAAALLRSKYASRHTMVRVMPAAVCPNASSTDVRFWTVDPNGNATGNESDVRCLGRDYLDGQIASTSKKQVLGAGLAAKFTPTQCLRCSRKLGRVMPPTCLKRAISDNLVSFSVPCLRIAETLSSLGAVGGSGGSGGGGGGGGGGSEWRRPAPPHLLVIDAEGFDSHVAANYFTSGMSAPGVVIYEQTHLKGSQRAKMHAMLRMAGMTPYNKSRFAFDVGSRGAPDPMRELVGLLWPPMQRIFHENAVWVLKGLLPPGRQPAVGTLGTGPQVAT